MLILYDGDTFGSCALRRQYSVMPICLVPIHLDEIRFDQAHFVRYMHPLAYGAKISEQP